MIYESCIFFMFWLSRKRYFFLELIQTHIFVSQGSIKFEKKCKNSNVENTRRHFPCSFQSLLKSGVILKKLYDEAPTNEGSDGLRHAEKMIQFKEKVSIKRPWMDGWTSCVIWKNRFILKKNIWWSAHKWRIGRFASCWKSDSFYLDKASILDNMKFFQMKFSHHAW